MKNYIELKNIIENHNSFILTTHVNPDADALGSELALYYTLNKIGKEVSIINHSATPYNLEFMDKEKVIMKFDETKKILFEKAEVLIFLDLNQTNRVVSMENVVKNFNGFKICIDHHQDPEDFADLFYGGSEYSATGEIIYEFINETNIIKLDYEIAYQLYAAIMTDTGSFRFERTSPKIHMIVAELLKLGVNPVEIYDKIYNQFHFSRVKLLGDALSTINIDSTGKIAFMFLTKEQQGKNNSVEADVDGFVNYCLTIKDVEIGILIYELKDGIKISFRSKGNIPVNKLAVEFGGGGHTNASGTRLYNVTIDDIKDKVVESAKKYISNGGENDF